MLVTVSSVIVVENKIRKKNPVEKNISSESYMS